MASGDSRRSSKGKKFSSSISSNDEESQWLSSNEWAVNAENNSMKPGRNSSNQNLPNLRYTNPLIEGIVSREEGNKRMSAEEVFSDDISVPQTVSSTDFSSMQPVYLGYFDNPPTRIHGKAFPIDSPVARPVSTTNFPFTQPVYTDYFDRSWTPPHSSAENQNVKLSKEDYKKNSIARVQRTDRNFDERASKSNRLNEKKQSEDKFSAQRLQETKLQKKLSGQPKKSQCYQEKCQESLNIGSQSSCSHNDPKDQYAAKYAPSHTSQNLGVQQAHSTTDNHFHVLPDPETQSFLSCIDSIRKQVDDLQHPPDNKNMVTQSSGGHEAASNILLQQPEYMLAKKKLKNKLVELEEKKMMNDELVRKLADLQEESNLGLVDENSASGSSQRTSRAGIHLRSQRAEWRKRNTRAGPSTKRDNVRKEINSSFPARRHYEAEGRANEDTVAPNPGLAPNPGPAPNSGPAPSAGPNIKRESLHLTRDTISKIRKLQNNADLIEECNELLCTYLEQEVTGAQLTEEYLSTCLDWLIIQSAKEIDDEYCDRFEEADVHELIQGNDINETNGEDERIDMKEEECSGEDAECSGGVILTSSPADINNAEAEEEQQENLTAINMYEKVDQMDHAIRKNEFLVHNLYRHLLDANKKPGSLDVFLRRLSQQGLSTDFDERTSVRPSYSDNVVRSSGEGSYNINRNSGAAVSSDYIQSAHTVNRNPSSISSSSDNIQSMHAINKNPSSIISSSSDNIQTSNYLQNVCRRENVPLTRQNIANIESQNYGFDRNLHKKEASARKKDNNLSNKVVKHRISGSSQNSIVDQQMVPKENLDSRSLHCSGPSHTHIGEIERKTILNILKRDKRTEKVYERNPDRVANNSSDFEANDDQNSALASDLTPSIGPMSQTFEDANDSFQHRIHPTAQRVYPDSKLKVNANVRTTEVSQRSNEFQPSVSHQNDANRVQQCQQQVPPNFINQLQRQANQLSELFQAPFSQAEPTNYQSSNLNANSIPSMQPMSVSCNSHYQQLLLCLTQCYHTMYLQQLEIQQLRHTLQQGFNTETYNAANNANTVSESVGARPYNMAAMLNPPNMFSHDQPSSPLSSSSLVPEFQNEHFKCYPPMQQEFGTGISSIHRNQGQSPPTPSNNEKQITRDTLNNQVPPRTRANNFLDNFRSYSRLNLLSASTNVKRNEDAQVQVNPSILNETCHYSQTDTNPDGTTEEYDRPTRDPELPDFDKEDLMLMKILINHRKKANADNVTSTNSKQKMSENQKKVSISNVNSDVRNILPERYHVYGRETSLPSVQSSCVNVIQLQSQEDSKLGNFSSILPSSSESIATVPDVPGSEFLVNLYKEAKLLTDDLERNNALKIIRDIVLSDKGEGIESKIQNDYAVSSPNNMDHTPEEVSGSAITTEIDFDNIYDSASTGVIHQATNDNAASWPPQALATSISPLNKPVSTGAIRKKPKIQRINSNEGSDSQSSRHPTAKENSNEDENAFQPQDSDRVNYIINVIVLEIKCLFLNWGSSSKDGIFTVKVCATFNSFIVTKLSHFVKLHSKSYSALHNALKICTLPLLGKKLSECETHYLLSISELLHTNLNALASSGDLDYYRDCLEEEARHTEIDWNEMEMCSTSEQICLAEGALFPNEDIFQSISLQNPLLDSSEVRNEIQPTCVTSSCGDLRSQFGTEAEIQHEVEAGAEADLAEADQSPSQQGSIAMNALGSIIVKLDPDSSLNNAVPTSTNSVSTLIGAEFENDSEIAVGANYCPETSNDEDICLDDIPTKLSSNVEEEQNEPARLKEVSSCDDLTDESSDLE